MQPLQVRSVGFGVFGQGGEGHEDGGIFEDGGGWDLVSCSVVVDYVDVRELGAKS